MSGVAVGPMGSSQPKPTTMFAPDGSMRVITAPSTPLCAGLETKLYHVAGSYYDAPPSPINRMILHISAPIRATCRVAGRSQSRVQVPGDIDLVPSGESGVWEDDRPATMLTFYVAPALLRATAEDMGMNTTDIALAPQLQARDPQIEYVASAFYAALSTETPMERLFAESLGTALVARMLHRFATDVPPLKGGLSKRQLQRVIDHIEANIDESLSLKDLATVAGSSISHFKAQFRQSMSMPVHQYVLRRRVECAKSLIMKGGAISQVALDAGFAHQSHLARCMRRLLGVSPMELARQSR
ncbi:MAG TPA: AraC family transcriptional regulator [Aliidongia sp.]|uniref:AraC family transcriptional regulator n=1 Tax=Aliidongia sp. TaxID=1914230 RepID=UPI002DDD91D3|nr:AraC family transcriptional regulator [Aliidongia sp.]HEV2673561.1 AraC family transcriptional regulator [Aliidongia sp.]